MSRGALVGLSILALLFIAAVHRVVMPRLGGGIPGEKVLRFAHYRLEEPIVAALDQLARDYEAKHPGVRIEQITVPLRGWRAWLNAQLVGGTAPDLIYLFAIQTEMYPRHFLPLSAAVNTPNPYNTGTQLADLPWRETFLDGLLTEPNYHSSLQEYYGIPLSMATWRLLINRDLLREVSGSGEVPRDFRDFVRLREQVDAYVLRTGRKIVPIAGSADRTLPAMERLFQSQTQTLGAAIDRRRQIHMGFNELGIEWLRNRWDFDSPGIRGGLALLREFGRSHQPGFLQSRQEDATFLFLQERALMVAIISWDYRSLRELAPFVIGAIELPFAGPNDPDWGKNSLGSNSEASVGLRFSFGVTRNSDHPDEALDFLRYLTSARGNSRFASLSGNLPALAGLPIDDDMRDFAPRMNGTPPGPRLVRGVPGSANATNRIWETELHRLVADRGSVPQYIEELKRRYDAALRRDLHREVRELEQRIKQEDTLLAVMSIRPDANEPGFSLRWEAQAGLALEAAQITRALLDSTP